MHNSQQQTWVPLPGVCALEPLQPGQTAYRFNGVPVKGGTKATTLRTPITGINEDRITFCPAFHESWFDVESTRTVRGVHYNSLHVDIGTALNADQITLAQRILQEPNIRTSEGTGWLVNFLVNTMIHEATHSFAFTTRTLVPLVDIYCTTTKTITTQAPGPTTTPVTLPPGNPWCMGQIAAGLEGLSPKGRPQGHLDAQMFTTYAMAMWVNIVEWYVGARPRLRTQ